MAVNDNDVLELTVIHDNDETGEQINRLQYIFGSPAPVTELLVLDDVADIIEQLYNLVVGLISLRNVLREVKVFNITQAVLLGSTDANTYVGGSNASGAVPQGVAPFLHFVTDVPRVILSKYLPSICAPDVTVEGNLSPAGLLEVVAYGTDLMSTHIFTTRSYDYGYFSPKVLDFVLPQVMVAKNVLAYQRRRKKGSGS